MFQAIRRVISEPDDVGESARNDTIMDEMKSDNVNDAMMQNSDGGELAKTSPAVVEPENNNTSMMDVEDENGRPLSVIDGSRQYDSSSSLSYDGEEEDDDDEPLLATLPRSDRTRGTLPRVNSRTSSNSSLHAPGSQTSSRDWGWFEDVHLSDFLKPDPEQTVEKPPKTESGTYTLHVFGRSSL